jgi:hypothetical protein
VVKKLIFIIGLMLLVIGFGIFESVFVTRYFTDISESLSIVDESLLVAGEGGDFSDAKAKTEVIFKKWRKKKFFLHTLCNHSILRNFEDKLVSMTTWIECDGYGDARSFCNEAMNFAKEIAHEAHPHLGNLM